jgi:hypothetical protein
MISSSAFKHSPQESPGPFIPRMIELAFGRPLFKDLSLIEETDTIRKLAQARDRGAGRSRDLDGDRFMR